MQQTLKVVLQQALRRTVLLTAGLGVGTSGAADATIAGDSPLAFGVSASIGVAAASQWAQWPIPPLAERELLHWQAWLSLLSDFTVAMTAVPLLLAVAPDLVAFTRAKACGLSVWSGVIGAMIFGLVGGLLRDEKTDYRHVLTLLAFFWAAP